MPDFDYDKLVQAIVLALKQHDEDKYEKELEKVGEWYRQASENAVREVKRILSND